MLKNHNIGYYQVNTVHNLQKSAECEIDENTTDTDLKTNEGNSHSGKVIL